MNSDLRRIVFIGILCAQGIVLGIVERSLPSPFVFAPGAKLGLTNIISVIALMTLPFNDCILLTFLRITITALLGGGLSMFLYTFAGSFLSLFLMKAILPAYSKFMSLLGVSMFGGVINNMGQLLIACILAESKYILLYLPVLTVMGMLAGLVVGLISEDLLKYMQMFSLIKRVVINER